jgi:hypothetical protein
MAAKRKPPVRALSRRKALAVVRIVGPGTKALSLSDLEWRALRARAPRRQRRSS